MKKNRFKSLIALALVLFTGRITVYGNDAIPIKPASKDKCIVCGMFVAKYPDWTAEIIFNDGDVFFFDGCKDLFKYYFKMKKYSQERDKSEISAVFVTDYYDISFISAFDALYVIGSDVYGPMGRELIALKSIAEAEEFLNDHQGKQILRFDEISLHLIDRLD